MACHRSAAGLAALCRKWCSILVLGLPLGVLGCGATPSTATITSGGAGGAVSSLAGAGGGSSGSSSALALPESCTEFGYDIQLGCEDCPAAAPTCECLDLWRQAGGTPLLPERACTFGKCLAAVDCDQACQHFDPATGPGPEFLEDIQGLQDCYRVLSECNGDADCGTGNFCIEGPGNNGFSTHGYRGHCSEPGNGSSCNENVDCLQGSRCVVFARYSDPQTGEAIPFGYCSTGEDDQTCVVDDDCVTPYQCVNVNAAAGGPIGQCSTGADEEPCVDDDDCVAPLQCVSNQCSAGAVDDRCLEASDCQSGFCFTDPAIPGTCTSGQYPAECRRPEDCQSGRCSIPIDGDHGYCTSGDLGSPCQHDADCASALCGFNPNDEGQGICVDGSTGSPCLDDSDCPESTCLAPSNAPSAMCMGAMPGAPCEDDGVCPLPNGDCFKGKCG
ncbi:MAG TPA: hypothetical protein VHO25_12345 [Polyangiaceae bacterium]|nr:hypothetical protein [Polyangiaceae bacterium]